MAAAPQCGLEKEGQCVPSLGDMWKLSKTCVVLGGSADSVCCETMTKYLCKSCRYRLGNIETCMNSSINIIVSVTLYCK